MLIQQNNTANIRKLEHNVVCTDSKNRWAKWRSDTHGKTSLTRTSKDCPRTSVLTEVVLSEN